MDSAELCVRVGTADDWAAVADLQGLVFHHPGPETRDIEGSVFEPERSTLRALAATGRVRELTAGALARASTAFGWRRMPNPIEVF